MITIVAHSGWKLHHLEIKLDFLNDVLKVEVYVSLSGRLISDYLLKGDQSTIVASAVKKVKNYFVFLSLHFNSMDSYY